MANIKSQKKRNLQNERRNMRNKSVKSDMKTRVRNALEAAANGSKDATEIARLAFRKIDKAASAGVIHKNQAANRKIRLAKKLAAASSK